MNYNILEDVFLYKGIKVTHCENVTKVTTDSLLLANSIPAQFIENKKILEVGSGTGIISLILAKHNPLFIDAIDIHEDAYFCTKLNFETSDYKDILQCYHSNYIDYLSHTEEKYYDLIISNPPFLNGYSQYRDENRNTSRNIDQFNIYSFIELSLEKSKSLIIIVPFSKYFNIVRFSLSIEKNPVVLNIDNHRHTKRSIIKIS